MKEVVKVRAQVYMDALVQQMESSFTAKVLHFPLPSGYNMLLGRLSLNSIRAIPSAYHMVVKFPMKNRVEMVRGDQRLARDCYLAFMKHRAVDNIHVDDLDTRTNWTPDQHPQKNWNQYNLMTSQNTSPTLDPS